MDIIYKKCSEVPIEDVFKAFNEGFKDYIIKVDLNLSSFKHNFFAIDGNDLTHSFIAYHANIPIGVLLSSFQFRNGLYSARCGALSVSLEYRGKNISQNLWNLHKDDAIKHGVKELMLEVIVGNDRAKRFYEKLGYEKIYEINYYEKKNLLDLSNRKIKNKVVEIDYDEILNLKDHLDNIHINYQNDLLYIKRLNRVSHYGVYNKDDLIAVLSIGHNGTVYLIYVLNEYRNQGIASDLLTNAINSLSLDKLSFTVINNKNLSGYIRKIDCNKKDISQFEMYKIL